MGSRGKGWTDSQVVHIKRQISALFEEIGVSQPVTREAIEEIRDYCQGLIDALPVERYERSHSPRRRP